MFWRLRLQTLVLLLADNFFFKCEEILFEYFIFRNIRIIFIINFISIDKLLKMVKKISKCRKL